MTEHNSLRDQFLISMPTLEDSIFTHTVTYVCDHNEHGAMGVIVNHPLNITLGEVFSQLELDASPDVVDVAVLAGGPVNTQQGLVLHRDTGTWESTLHITDEVCLTASKDIVDAMAENQAPPNAQLVLGYAGWSAGQLEEEIANNFWLTMPANAAIIFDTPVAERWAAAAKQLGIDLDLISSTAGHA